MISLQSHPRLTSKARLHYDRHAQQHMLLYPEKGLVLNQTALAILQLCTGEHSVADIVLRLRQGFGTAPERVERDVLSFLVTLEQRALIRDNL
jgi:pyrroloquinoline quinone biosynthesis protein D